LGGLLVQDHADDIRAAVALRQVVCRTKHRDDGTTELRLEWNGNKGTGTIRTIAPSGETTTTRVHAERYRGMIIVDSPRRRTSPHAAVVAPSNGKQAMRVGSGNYAACGSLSPSATGCE
jgi:hypothetical protein